MLRVCPLCLCAALSLLAAADGGAQKPRASTLIATVAIDGSRVLLPGAEVVIADLHRAATSDIVGEADISNVPPGQHVVRVRALGYTAAEAPLLFRGDTVTATFYLRPIAVAVDPVLVSATRITPGLEELEVRRAMGVGRFLTQGQLDSASATDFQTLMALEFPGLIAIPLANGDRVVGSTRSSCNADLSRTGLTSSKVSSCRPGAPCPVPVILDGQDLHDAVSDVVHTRNLAAVEFYTGGQVPAEYHVQGYACGVLLLWSRRP